VRKLTLSLAVMAALLPARGYPLGLGEIELNSALNQELNADIEILSASPEDAEQLIVQLGSREAFNRAGIDRPYLLQQLKFKIVDKDGSPYVKVYTNSAVREPFLSFLLEIDWPQGNLLREYTLLLDPPVYNTGATAGRPAEGGHPFIDPADTQSPSQSATQQYYPDASATGAATVSADSGRSMSYQTPTQSGQSRQTSAYTPATARGAVEKYRVKENDTLWSMASRMRPDESVSVEQMMLALVRKNPEAFIQENINGVKRGYILRVPDRDEASQINRQQALTQAREHAALWREYTRAASSATPASAMQAKPAATDSSNTAADAASGQLSIVGASEEAGSEHAGSAQAPGSELARLQQELAYAREQLESERIEKETLRSRLSDLEQKVQSVINMDDAQLAELQQSLQQDTATAEPAEELATDDAIADDLSADELAEEAAEMAEDAVQDMAEAADELATDEAPGDEATSSEAELTDEVVFTDELAEAPSTEDSADAQQMDSAADYAEPEAAIEPPPFAQKQPKSFIDRLMNDQKMLAIIGGGLAFVLLLLALLLKRMRGRKADTDMDDDSADRLDIDDATLDDMDATTEMMAPGYEKADAMDDTQIDAPSMDDESVDDSVFSLDEPEQPATDEDQDDVLAEADVYLAYGIYQQAEDLLQKAIEQNPERDDYRMKLLEVHYAAKDANAFEQLAQEVHSRKGNDSSYWGRVAAMGAELVPGSALFAGAGDVLPDFDTDAVIPEKPATTDLELDADDQSSDTTELELSDTDELDLASDLAELESDAATDVEATAETDESDVSSELEFDLGELNDQEATSSADESLSAEDELDLEDEDFSLDFDAADLGFEEPEDDKAEDKSAADSSDELNLDEDLDLGISLDESSESDTATETADEFGLDSELDFDASELNLDDDSSSADDEISLDMDDADDFDLDDSLDLSDDSNDAGMAPDGDEEFDISELSEDIDEVATKLDLAKAYIDMGDSDGARSILEEVKAEGNQAQQQEAEALLQKAD